MPSFMAFPWGSGAAAAAKPFRRTCRNLQSLEL
jgi:hypothetical protein